jgi:LL-diaminopimelate aminotransferase
MVLNAKAMQSDFLNNAGSYAFADIDAAVAALKRDGKDAIDFGVGDPTDRAPYVLQRGTKAAVKKRECSGYPSYNGSPEYRTAVANWFQRRFGVKLDPEKELTATIGSKEAIFSFPTAYVNAGDTVLIPDPGYPPWTEGTRRCYGVPVHMPLTEANGFLPDLDSVDKEAVKKAKILWMNSPSNPTTRIAPDEYVKKTIDFCKDNEIILASDEAYSEMSFDGPKPKSVFQFPGAKDVAVGFNSLSKRSNATGYRVGFAFADEELLKPFKNVQKQIHSGVPWFIQDGAIAALEDEKHVEKMRKSYTKKRDIILPALQESGFPKAYAEGTFYVYAQAPAGYSAKDATKKLLCDAWINTTPAPVLSKASPPNGEGFVRFALVPSLERTQEAAERIRKVKF